MWGIIPAAGMGSRIQPLAFSKELLPVGCFSDGQTERPRAVSEYLVERMIQAGATKICWVIGPGKCDIVQYFGEGLGDTRFAYVVQPKPAGLCDSVFRAAPFIHPDEIVTIGLPDTIWFPVTGLQSLPDDQLSLLLFPVDSPQHFDAVLLQTGEEEPWGRVCEIRVKRPNAGTRWVWGAMKMPGHVYHALHKRWLERTAEGNGDEFLGTLINDYLDRGGSAVGVRAGRSYVDTGTLNGYREALRLLALQNDPSAPRTGNAAQYHSHRDIRPSRRNSVVGGGVPRSRGGGAK